MAYAVGPDGHRRLLGITLGPEESENSWSEFLEQLLERGLSGVQLVIADEHAGLAAAVRRFLPEVRRQRCTVHLQRNVLAKVPHRLRKRVAREVAAVFRAPGLAESKKRLAEITARWHKELPEAVNVLERGFTAATQFYAFPEPHCTRLPPRSGRRPSELGMANNQLLERHIKLIAITQYPEPFLQVGAAHQSGKRGYWDCAVRSSAACATLRLQQDVGILVDQSPMATFTSNSW